MISLQNLVLHEPLQSCWGCSGPGDRLGLLGVLTGGSGTEHWDKKDTTAPIPCLVLVV